MIVGEVFPSGAELAVILADGAPSSLAQVRPPAFPVRYTRARLRQTFFFCLHVVAVTSVGLRRWVPSPIKVTREGRYPRRPRDLREHSGRVDVCRSPLRFRAADGLQLAMCLVRHATSILRRNQKDRKSVV